MAWSPPVPDEELQQAVEALTVHGSQVKAAAALGMSRGGLQDRLRQAARKGLMLDHPPAMPGYVIKETSEQKNGDGSLRSRSVRQVQESGEKFEPLPGFMLKQRSTLSDAEQRIRLQWHIERPDAQSTRDLIDAIKGEFGQYKGYAKLVRPPKDTYADLCNYYPIVDPHVGMLSYGKETGQSNDLKIGLDRIEGTLQRLIGWSPPAETAVIINTGDFFHADNQRNVTEGHGHQLDVDGRDHKVKYAGVNMLRKTIDFALQRHKRVIVKNLKGNHDSNSAMWLNIALGMFYANEPRVQLDMEDANNDHFFHLFGVNYVGATHGHTMKPDRMYVMMAEDNPEYWNASLYRWCIFGHIHHETKKQIGSLICESFSQPVPRDSFAHSNAYRSGSAMQSITLHNADGEKCRQKQNFPPSRGKPAVEAAA
jgi:predicted phosphodiesterase